MAVAFRRGAVRTVEALVALVIMGFAPMLTCAPMPSSHSLMRVGSPAGGWLTLALPAPYKFGRCASVLSSGSLLACLPTTFYSTPVCSAALLHRPARWRLPARNVDSCGSFSAGAWRGRRRTRAAQRGKEGMTRAKSGDPDLRPRTLVDSRLDRWAERQRGAQGPMRSDGARPWWRQHSQRRRECPLWYIF